MCLRFIQPWQRQGRIRAGDNTRRARLNCISHLLSLIAYEDLTPETIELPPREEPKGYVRPPMSDQTFVPEVY